MKPIKVLIMSVSQYSTNWTAKWFEKNGGIDHCIVCLPKQYEENAESYSKRGIETYIYDEKKYIGPKIEYFGFKPRNCGGIGRQGIAEAVEKFGNDFLCFQIDDDIGNMCVMAVNEYGETKSTSISKWKNLEKLIYAEEEFYQLTGIECMAKTGATPPTAGEFISNHKIFNNFIMRKGIKKNFSGFAALCSDDQRFNLYRNLIDLVPMISTSYATITFHQSQGDREDGNAVLYNSDCSWKKSFALKMIFPQAIAQRIRKETNRVLFRENILCSKIYPPICLEENGEIIGRA